MILTDKHVHTDYCDGKNTAEEMVLAAIDKGIKCLGFSGHSYTDFDADFCMPIDKVPEYIAEIERLKLKYADKIEILCGVEQDQFSGEGIEEFDYAIGSTHYICCDGDYIAIDDTAAILVDAAEKYFDGDMYALCEKYFETEADVIAKTGAEIIGHFDLVSKFNENNALFDDNNPRYIAAWQAAADKLLETGAVFEINTGAISRGYRTQPYPSLQMIEYISSKGGKFILSSDSHSVDTLCYEFDKYEKYVIKRITTVIL